MKILKIFLLFLLIWLQYSLWWGKNGIFDYIAVRKRVFLTKKENIDLDFRNKKIILEIQKLNNHMQNN